MLSTEILGLFVPVNDIILSMTASVFAAALLMAGKLKAHWVSITGKIGRLSMVDAQHDSYTVIRSENT